MVAITGAVAGVAITGAVAGVAITGAVAGVAIVIISTPEAHRSGGAAKR